MRRVAVASSLVVLLVTGVVAQTSPLEGTWKLNVAKSTFKPGPPPKSQVISWTRVDGGFRFTTDTINGQGQSSKTETLEKNDGSDGPVTGGTTTRTRYLRRINDFTYEDGDKENGKQVMTRRTVISKDGKTITSTQSGINAGGQPVNNVAIYEKQ